jgi:hypothetical protein
VPQWHVRGLDGRLRSSEVFVRHVLVAALLGSSITLLVAIGCSAPSPDGTTLNRGRSSSSSGDDGDDEGEKTSSGGNTSCSSHAKVDDRPACDECARGKCCDEVLECDKTSDCAAMMKCFDDCQGDVFCQLTCSTVHEKGASVLNEFASCAQTKCGTECPSTTPDAGGDPFADAF